MDRFCALKRMFADIEHEMEALVPAPDVSPPNWRVACFNEIDPVVGQINVPHSCFRGATAKGNACFRVFLLMDLRNRSDSPWGKKFTKGTSDPSLLWPAGLLQNKVRSWCDAREGVRWLLSIDPCWQSLGRSMEKGLWFVMRRDADGLTRVWAH